MSELDAAVLAQRVSMLGLVTESQVRECFDDTESNLADSNSLMRVMERKGYLTPWQSQKLLKGDKDGFFLGGYRILYRIASGTFGRVYRADDPVTGIVVAVKVLRHRWSEDAHAIELFYREGKVGMALRHPSIVQTLAVNKETGTGQYYLVMEFVEGGNLRDFLGIRKKLSPSEALGFAEEAAAGLAYAFSKGMMHRDLKLTNILISSQGKAKLVDFGLANIYSGFKVEEETKVERTVDYAGLERATGVKANDVRSDIYFLGCILYEILTGRPPMERSKNKAVRMQKHRFHQIAPIQPGEITGPPSIVHLVETMMSIDPLKRHQTPAQALEAIRAVRRDLDGKTVDTGPVTRSLFVVEQNERLQDVIRNKFKEMGFRVLMSTDPERALARFQQQPFDALILDAGSTGDLGARMFREILLEAEKMHHPCASVLILSAEQAEWKDRLAPNSNAAILVRPVTLRQLSNQVCDLLKIPRAE